MELAPIRTDRDPLLNPRVICRYANQLQSRDSFATKRPLGTRWGPPHVSRIPHASTGLEPGERIDRTGPTAPYMQIEAARTTTRRAVALLREDGLVCIATQRGTFVAERKSGGSTDE